MVVDQLIVAAPARGEREGGGESDGEDSNELRRDARDAAHSRGAHDEAVFCWS
jgi:hypothetical protein